MTTSPREPVLLLMANARLVAATVDTVPTAWPCLIALIFQPSQPCIASSPMRRP